MNIRLTLLTAWLIGMTVAQAQPLTPHELDKSKTRTFTLDNKLSVFLVSDPAFNKSAAALDVGVGSLSDPRARQGLAHFLEHMLFLGTEKYPEVEAYSEYLKQRGGYSNAFTAGDHTNYHFEVQHDALDGALDRFAQFFIAPLFTPEYINREVKAVQSEHKKNLMNDGWREYQLLRNHMRKDHPANHFSTGSEKTLDGIQRKEFVDFYDRYYSADRMALVILSSASLDELEAMTRKHFGAIKNRNRPRIIYPENPMDKADAFRLISFEPIKDLRELSVVFSLPPTRQYWASKPAGLIGHCLGHEGKGSLLSYLKKKGWATGLSAGPYAMTDQYGQMSVSIQLTEDGLANKREIIRSVFSYLDMLKKEGVPSYIFEESARQSALQYTWSDKGEGTSRAVSLATQLNNHPSEDPSKLPYRYEKHRPDLVQKILSVLTPDNAICLLSAKGVKTDQVDPHYGTNFSLTVEKGAFFESLKSPAKIDGLHPPQANRFLSKSQSITPEQPILVVDEPGARLYYLQDTEFRRPKTSMNFRFRAPTALNTARNQVIGALYGAAVQEQLNELAYPAMEAGVHYGLSGGHEGLSISVSGYSDSAQILLNEITPHFTLTLSEARFEAIKERILRGWRNFPQEAAWQVTRTIGREIRRKSHYLPSELIPVAEKITLDDLKTFPQTLFAACHLEGLIHGNVTRQEAESAFNGLRKAVSARPIPATKCYETEVLVQPAGELLTYVHNVPSNNSCFWRMLVLGGDNPKVRAAGKIIGNFMSQPFYTEMRTKQQLGYIVWAVATGDAGQNYLAFIIQSGDYPADELRERADTFIKTLPAQFNALPEASFAKIRDAVRQELLEKPKSIGEKAGTFNALAFERDGDFDRTQDTIRALDSLTAKEVGEILKKTLASETRRGYDVLTFAHQHKAKDSTTATVKNLDTFRKGRTFARNPK